MQSNYTQYRGPQFRILSDNQIAELHLATLQILENTGVKFDHKEAIEILDGIGADVSNPNRVKIPSYLVEKALATAPKTITLYSRDGEPAIVLNGMTGCHFGGIPDPRNLIDPYSGKVRTTYVEDIADWSRLIDALPNMEWSYTASCNTTLPTFSGLDISDRVTALQYVRNCSKPIVSEITNVQALRDIIELCSVIAGGEDNLRKKPFLSGSCEPVTPLVQGEDAMGKTLLCGEKGLPIVIYSMPMAGSTTPATWPGILALANAEVLSQLVVTQHKYPGTPVIYGGIPNIMDMKTTIFPYGSPELSFLVAALTEICHSYRLPMFGTAGCSDAFNVGAQMGAEVTYQILMTALSGADLVHDVGVMYHGTMCSMESNVFCDEIIDMVKVSMGGIEINEDTLPLDLIDRVGPQGVYISEKHTLNHFRKFWSPTVFDRSTSKDASPKNCEDLLKEKTIKLLETHQSKPLQDDTLKELDKMEKDWLKQVGLTEYPKKA